jgi:hypothetical protein
MALARGQRASEPARTAPQTEQRKQANVARYGGPPIKTLTRACYYYFPTGPATQDRRLRPGWVLLSPVIASFGRSLTGLSWRWIAIGYLQSLMLMQSYKCESLMFLYSEFFSKTSTPTDLKRALTKSSTQDWIEMAGALLKLVSLNRDISV